MKVGERYNPYRCFKEIIIIPAPLVEYPMGATAKLMLGVLMRHAGKDGRCFPSQKRLANSLGITVRQTRRVLTELKNKGFIALNHPRGKDRLRHKCIRYVFVWHKCFKEGGGNDGR